MNPLPLWRRWQSENSRTTMGQMRGTGIAHHTKRSQMVEVMPRTPHVARDRSHRGHQCQTAARHQVPCQALLPTLPAPFGNPAFSLILYERSVACSECSIACHEGCIASNEINAQSVALDFAHEPDLPVACQLLYGLRL